MNDYRFENHEIPVSVALTTPAVRMVGVEVAMMDDGGPPEYYIYPVVAIQSKVAHKFSKRVHKSTDSPRTFSTVEDMKADSWSHRGPELDIECLITDPTYGVCEWEFSRACNTRGRIIACPWPETEDAVRFQKVADELLASAGGDPEGRSPQYREF